MRISDWSSDVCSSDLLGFSADAERDEAGRLEADDDALVCLLLEQEVAPSVASQEECRRYYDANQKRFRTHELFEASQIGRAWCRARVCQFVKITVVAVSLKKKKQKCNTIVTIF